MTLENPNLNNESELKLGFKVGDQIRVKRTDGSVEDDWIVAQIEFDEEDIHIIVQKPQPDGRPLIKGFSQKRSPARFQELLDLNKK